LTTGFMKSHIYLSFFEEARRQSRNQPQAINCTEQVRLQFLLARKNPYIYFGAVTLGPARNISLAIGIIALTYQRTV